MRDNKIKFMTTTALMAAVICILGPLSLPIGPIPISLTNFAIYITMYILGTKRGLCAFLLYLLLGLVGLPVFSGFSGGPWKLFGPTGGYLIGFIPMALLIGLFLKKHSANRIACIIVMELATWIAYLTGTLWLAFQANMTFAAALAAGVTPFIILDLIKIVISSLIGPVLRKTLAPFTGING
jgi:biotin transport system substrate-specific component